MKKNAVSIIVVNFLMHNKSRLPERKIIELAEDFQKTFRAPGVKKTSSDNHNLYHTGESKNG